MHKLTAILSNHPSPLEKRVFDEQKTVEFAVEDPHDPTAVLDKLEPLVKDIKGDDGTAVLVRIFDESGNQIFDGTVTDRLQGTWMS